MAEHVPIQDSSVNSDIAFRGSPGSSVGSGRAAPGPEVSKAGSSVGRGYGGTRCVVTGSPAALLDSVSRGTKQISAARGRAQVGNGAFPLRWGQFSAHARDAEGMFGHLASSSRQVTDLVPHAESAGTTRTKEKAKRCGNRGSKRNVTRPVVEPSSNARACATEWSQSARTACAAAWCSSRHATDPAGRTSEARRRGQRRGE
jgi:hypothetical protein